MKDALFILLQHLLPQHLISQMAGYIASCNAPWLKNWLIKRFIKRYQVDLSEALIQQPEEFRSFNDFFTRALKPNLRTFDTDPDALCSPADGAVSEMGSLEHGRILQAKGRGYGLTTLLAGDPAMAQPFINGQFITIYLSPRDYHRVHMPVDGRLVESVYVPGDLYSVNQTTADRVDNLFARNERLINIFETERGPMALILVGAMIVSGIETVWGGSVSDLKRKPLKLYSQAPAEPISLKKGDELGRFHLGSTVILLLPEHSGEWLNTLSAGAGLRLGQRIATLNRTGAVQSD